MSCRRLVVLAAVVCAGALSGPVGSAVAQSGDAPRPKALFGLLNGANEVPAVGDPDGRGSAAAVLHGATLCYVLTVRRIGPPQLAHIHEGAAGANGPVRIDLTPPSTGGFGVSSACVAVAPDVADRLRANPAGFYWNVHTAEFPGGAIRGQVFTLGG